MTSEREYSYTWWKRGMDSSKVAPAPEKLAVNKEDEAQLKPTSSKPSLWNSGGTWEERNMSEVLHRNFGVCLIRWLSDNDPTSTGLNEVTVDDCSRASIIFVRNRPKLGFELTFNVEMKDGSQYTISEYTDYDDCFTINAVKGIGRHKNELEKWLSNFRRAFAQYFFEHLERTEALCKI